MIIFTSIASNYIPKAFLLARSVKKFHPDATFIAVLVETKLPTLDPELNIFDKIILAKDLGIENFQQFIFKHSIVEASTAVKGAAFKYLMNKFPNEADFVYLDPDILVISRLSELEGLLANDNNIVLTPHLSSYEKKLALNQTIDAVKDNELCALMHGTYNLGFLAIHQSKESVDFINWWTSRLEMFCYDDIPNGIFTDQKWIDLAPGFFNVTILRHPGYNVAPWNLSMRKVTEKDNTYFSNDLPLRFFHFSGFDSGANIGMIKKYVPNETDPIYTIRNQYVNNLEESKQNEFGKIPWSYNKFNSGETIKSKSRVFFRDNKELFNNELDPFGLSNRHFQSSNNPLRLIKRLVKKIFFK